MLLIMICAVGMNISMNYFLMPRYGVFGGAFAVVCTSSLVVLLTAVVSSKFIVARAERVQIIYYLILSLGMFLAVDFIHFQNVSAILITKLGVGSLICCLGILYREKELLKQIKERISKNNG